MIHEQLLTFVAGGHVVRLEASDLGLAPRSVEVKVTLDFGRQWSYSEPGWRTMSVGVSGGHAYWWSARHLVLLPNDTFGDPEVVDADEDILLVFRVDAGWLLVCETSLRLSNGQREISRMELPDIVVRGHWKDSTLVIETGQLVIEVEVVQGRLEAVLNTS